MKLSKKELPIVKMAQFRAAMGAEIDRYMLNSWFSPTEVKESEKLVHVRDSMWSEGSVWLKKLVKAKQLIDRIEAAWLLKFIGVSGSVAAQNAREGDDIDLFIVCRNYSSWICRAYLIAKVGDRMLKLNSVDKCDKLCINYIVEERAIGMSQQDIFTLHELLYLKPIYREGYYRDLLSSNSWITRFGVNLPHYGRRRAKIDPLAPLLISLNLIFFLAQLFYMSMRKHSPDLRRLITNLWEGSIQFYPADFRESKLALLPAATTSATASTTTKSTSTTTAST